MLLRALCVAGFGACNIMHDVSVHACWPLCCYICKVHVAYYTMCINHCTCIYTPTMPQRCTNLDVMAVSHAAPLVCKHFPSSCRNCCNITTPHSSTASTILQVSKEQFDKILDMCKQGEEQGAKLECGGKRLGDKGYYIEPTVFSNVQDDNIIATDEIFGPVQSILKWKTVEEVMAAVCP